MGLSQRLEMRQGQSLVMTPQLLQAIKLLQLSHLDLVAYVEAELERNPLLERSDGESAAEAGEDSASGDGAERSPDGEGAGPGEESWLRSDLEPSRSALERDMDTSFENVFQDESPVLPRHAGSDLINAFPATVKAHTSAHTFRASLLRPRQCSIATTAQGAYAQSLKNTHCGRSVCRRRGTARAPGRLSH